MENRDFNKMKDVIVNDIAISKDGVVWNNDSITNMPKGKPSFDAIFSFENFNIKYSY